MNEDVTIEVLHNANGNVVSVVIVAEDGQFLSDKEIAVALKGYSQYLLTKKEDVQ